MDFYGLENALLRAKQATGRTQATLRYVNLLQAVLTSGQAQCCPGFAHPVHR